MAEQAAPEAETRDLSDVSSAVAAIVDGVQFQDLGGPQLLVDAGVNCPEPVQLHGYMLSQFNTPAAPRDDLAANPWKTACRVGLEANKGNTDFVLDGARVERQTITRKAKPLKVVQLPTRKTTAELVRIPVGGSSTREMPQGRGMPSASLQAKFVDFTLWDDDVLPNCDTLPLPSMAKNSFLIQPDVLKRYMDET